MCTTPGARRLSLKHRAFDELYRLFPPLKYWGLRKGYLKKLGWVKSGWAHKPVDAEGNPLPWYTYPCIAFLEGRVSSEMRVFEYGSGQSTRWWAARVGHVDAVEDDPTWMAQVSCELPDNVELRFERSSGPEYANSILDRGAQFDVIVIDGSDRNGCARACLPALAEAGVVIWDNTQVPDAIRPGLGVLEQAGFVRLDFFGLGPLNMDPWCTSVLYRPAQNCFGL